MSLFNYKAAWNLDVYLKRRGDRAKSALTHTHTQAQPSRWHVSNACGHKWVSCFTNRTLHQHMKQFVQFFFICFPTPALFLSKIGLVDLHFHFILQIKFRKLINLPKFCHLKVCNMVRICIQEIWFLLWWYFCCTAVKIAGLESLCISMFS